MRDWDWLSWQYVLVSRFEPGNFPQRGDNILGYKFRLQYQDKDGTWHDYKRGDSGED